MKHPIVGDPIYGQADANIVRFLDHEIEAEERIALGGASRLLLHAYRLDFNYRGTQYSIHSHTDFTALCESAMEPVH